MGAYRVWCLSWDDDEEVATSYLDAPKSDDILDRYNLNGDRKWATDAREAVRMYAEYCHSQRDGCEGSWPLMFRVRLPDGTTRDYEVERHTVPEFEVETDSARERRLQRLAEAPR